MSVTTDQNHYLYFEARYLNTHCTTECTAILKQIHSFLSHNLVSEKKLSAIVSIADETEKSRLGRTKSPKRTVYFNLKQAFDTHDPTRNYFGASAVSYILTIFQKNAKLVNFFYSPKTKHHWTKLLR